MRQLGALYRLQQRKSDFAGYTIAHNNHVEYERGLTNIGTSTTAGEPQTANENRQLVFSGRFAAWPPEEQITPAWHSHRHFRDRPKGQEDMIFSLKYDMDLTMRDHA